MADFPGIAQHPAVISSLHREAWGVTAFLSNTVAATSQVWPSANLAIYIPFAVEAPYHVRMVWWANGTTTIAGNVDVGVYGDDGTLLLSAGSTAQATATVCQSVTLGTEVLLSPGAYYMAMSSSSGTATFMQANTTLRYVQTFGGAQQATALPLPATATFAAFAQARIPVFGIGRTTLI